MKLLVIGAGNMGLTYARAMAVSPLLTQHKLWVYDIDPKKKKALKEETHLDAFDHLEACLPKADLIFIAVKPYHTQALFDKMRPMVSKEQVFVSLMAGVRIKAIQQGLSVEKVVRAMPNLPAKVGSGVTSFTESKQVSKLESDVVRSLLDTTGNSIHVDTEKFIDASTGISGSGPAYVFYFMQSMLEAAKKMGFSENDSKVLVSSTFEGAVKMFKTSDASPKTWMDRVASKGGTTRAALDSMSGNKVEELISEAAFAAFDRAVELGGDS